MDLSHHQKKRQLRIILENNYPHMLLFVVCLRSTIFTTGLEIPQ